jgi:vacuolar-type H+-ATPase subunit E/Vma4
MYNGTIIRELMAMVERAERRVEQRLERQHLAMAKEEEQELQAIYSMQIPIAGSDRAYMGAA